MTDDNIKTQSKNKSRDRISEPTYYKYSYIFSLVFSLISLVYVFLISANFIVSMVYIAIATVSILIALSLSIKSLIKRSSSQVPYAILLATIIILPMTFAFQTEENSTGAQDFLAYVGILLIISFGSVGVIIDRLNKKQGKSNGMVNVAVNIPSKYTQTMNVEVRPITLEPGEELEYETEGLVGIGYQGIIMITKDRIIASGSNLYSDKKRELSIDFKNMISVRKPNYFTNIKIVYTNDGQEHSIKLSSKNKNELYDAITKHIGHKY